MGERISIGGYQAQNSVHTRGMQVFIDALSRITQGDVAVDFRPNITEAGNKAAELLDMVERGDLDGCYFSSSYLTPRVPELLLLDQHFAVHNRAQAYGLLDGPLGQALAETVSAKTGFTVKGYWDNGLRHISTPSKPITCLADCKGLILRILPSEDHKRIYAALGFKPVFIDVSDLPQAVNSGEVDAQENPLTNTYNFDLHKAHRTITLTGHLLGVAVVLFNAKSFASWSDDTKAAVTKAMAEATQAQRKFAQDDEATCAKAMREDGVDLVDLSPAQRRDFAAAVEGEVNTTRAGIDPVLVEMFETDMAPGAGVQL